ncbi:cobalt transporter CbiM [Siculibacillus lacustris]|uniref:Cobalt transporter CbiM n=1 Tax=Siculibacillus lacustris TaxID=1549641 RepID=A0A4Q9VWE5_9HYPH|nr:cobalt transporter CbiM [Siculibacillus lacustris]TBW40639.1 cobalt transporter CbiM [Siculibacillus lacustris]
MAHIPDGVLSLPVIIGGGLIAAAGVALGLRALDERDIPKTAILAAVFFVAGLFAVPVGPSSVHLLLGGLMGLILGVRAFPAVFVGLLLQAVMFGFGGLSSLGVDTVNMALPGVALAYTARPLMARAAPTTRGVLAAAVAALAVVGTASGVALALALSSPDYVPALRIVALTYLPLAVVEAIVTGFTVTFLARVEPEILTPAPREACP